MMTDIRILYVTCPHKKEAETLANALVGERLVACANILPGMESVYMWEEKVKTDAEVVLILKTSSSLVDRTIARLETLHSYNTPCILVLPIEKTNEAYARWLKGSLI